MRFRRSIKILPGVRINLGKTGVSFTVGRPGASVNIKPGRTPRTTLGIPGTGISWSSRTRQASSTGQAQPSPNEWRLLKLVWKLISWFTIVTFALGIIATAAVLLSEQ
ncbi:DUF4236 domain-containing protein [Paraburkholderia pallida]|uniref:DUF4236 domain-containing protein n=2 Tax=Paraburkholderia pallida TaxID=2547399 RepID=A0A4P7CXB9_9BURK|nr:DUF4236 domain-containing protein [Paraburkholderia pallida]